MLCLYSSVSCQSVAECQSDELADEKCSKLKKAVHDYFETDVTELEKQEPKLLVNKNLYSIPTAVFYKQLFYFQPGVQSEDQVKADVRAMVGTFSDTNFTGRAIARIFHGISSPCFPPQMWGRTRYWRLHLTDNFPQLCKIATAEILKLK